MRSSGERRHYMTVEVPKRVSDGMGNFTKTWVPKYRVWASIWPISGNERVRSDKTQLTMSHRIRIPFISDFKPDWRLTKKNRIFGIGAIINIEEMDEELELMCKEEVK